MTVPGFGGPGDTVGAIYVKVLTDTSGVKGEIEDALNKGGKDGSRIFTRSFKQQQEKDANDLLFSSAVRRKMEAQAKTLGRDIAIARSKGVKSVPISLGVDMDRELQQIAAAFGKSATTVRKQWEAEFGGILKSEIDKSAKEMEKKLGGIGQTVGSSIGDSLNSDLLDRQVKALAQKVTKEMAEGMDNSFENLDKRLAPEVKKLAQQFDASEIDVTASLRKQMVVARQEYIKTEEQRISSEEKIHEEALRLNRKYNEQVRLNETKHQREDIRWATERFAISQRIQDEEDRRFTARGAAIMKANAEIEKEDEKRRKRSAGKNTDSKGVSRLVNSLRRMGTGGAFDTITNLFGGLIGLADKMGKGVEKVFKGMGKGASWLGDEILDLADKFTKLGGTLAKAGGALGAIGGGLEAAAGPAGWIVSLIAVVGVVSLIASAITMLSPLVFNLLGIFTLFAGALFSTAAAGALLVPVLISMGAGIGVMMFVAKDAASAVGALFKASASGDPKDWEAYAKALDKLSPAAEKAVRAFKPLFSGLKDLKRQGSESFFDDMASSISKFQPVADAVKGSIDGIAKAMGDVVDSFFALGENPVFMTNLKAILDSIAPIMTNIGGALVNFFAGLVNFFGLLSPLAIQFSAAIKGVSDRFLEWTSTDASRKSITDFFNNAYIIAGKVINIITTLGQILMAVFTASQGPLAGNESLLDKINRKLDEWLLWVQNNRGTIEGWLQTAAGFARDVYNAARDIVAKFVEWNTPENQAKLSRTVEIVGNLATFAMDAAQWVSTLYANMVKVAQWVVPPWLRWAMGGGDTSPISTPSVKSGIARGISAAKTSPTLSVRGTPNRRAFGGLVNQKELSWLGESGPELVVPLRRPLGLIDPQARPVAKMLQDMKRAPQSTGPQKVVNLTQNITPIQSDPHAIASSVVNRAVALARI